MFWISHKNAGSEGGRYSSPVVRLHLSHFQTQAIVRKSLLSDTIFCSRYPDFVLSFSLTTQPCLSLVTTTIKLGVWPKSNGQTSVGKRTEAGTGWPARQDLSLITKSYAIWRHGTTLTRDMTARKGVADYIFFSRQTSSTHATFDPCLCVGNKS